jgi:hypothetical protein
MVVLPAASSPTIKIRISFLEKRLLNKLWKDPILMSRGVQGAFSLASVQKASLAIFSRGWATEVELDRSGIIAAYCYVINRAAVCIHSLLDFGRATLLPGFLCCHALHSSATTSSVLLFRQVPSCHCCTAAAVQRSAAVHLIVCTV